MAGANASLYLAGEPAFVLDRSEAYIGVMMDDLTTRSTTEPYRMFTSRAEYRLALREDNARDRLAHHGYRLGLISPDDYSGFEDLRAKTAAEIALLRRSRIAVSGLGSLGERFQKSDNVSLADLLKQPGIELTDILPILAAHDGAFSENAEVLKRSAISIRYEGYITKQQREIDKFRRLEVETIPESFAYQGVPGLRTEAREKFRRFRPGSLGQAGRIEGVTPGDVAVLSVFLKRHKAAGA